AFAFRIKKQHFASPETVSSSPQSGNKRRIGINGDDLHQPSNQPHDSAAKHFRCPQRKRVAKNTPWQHNGDSHGVNKALVVGTKNEWAFARQLFDATHSQLKAILRKDLKCLRE